MTGALHLDTKQYFSWRGDCDLPNHCAIGAFEAAGTSCRRRLTITDGSPARTGKFLPAIYNSSQKQCGATDSSQSSFQLLPIN
jgi:hypothetical protein